jgi:hypothetical protein
MQGGEPRMAFLPLAGGGSRKPEIPEDDSEDTVLCVCDCVIGNTVEDGVWLMRDEVKAYSGRRCLADECCEPVGEKIRRW